MTLLDNNSLPPPKDNESSTEILLQLAGKPYNSSDPYRCRIRALGEARCYEINDERDDEKRLSLMLRYLNKDSDKTMEVLLPFTFEFGFNITIGAGTIIGHGAMLLDQAPITIGARTLIGPNVQFYTPQHPLSPEERNGLLGKEWASPITIGNDCWIGGSVIILGGVVIAEGCTIGAGTVVTKSVEPRCVVVGNPGRVVKRV